MMDLKQVGKNIIKCDECGTEFVKIMPQQRFCSILCKNKYYRMKAKLKLREQRAAEIAKLKKKDLFAA
jgi:hypothetical protein